MNANPDIRRTHVVAALLAGILLLCGSAVAAGQQSSRRTANDESQLAGRRMALVVGNDAYPSSPLKNAVHDADDVATALRKDGFTVQLATNLTREAFDQRVDAFVNELRTGDAALFYYSGHGIQLSGENYLLGTDFVATDEVQARNRSVSASAILERMEAHHARVRVLILDACRNNPFNVGGRSLARGLAMMNTSARGTVIAFATAPGAVASDNPQGRNGLFTSFLVQGLAEPGVDIVDMLRDVAQNVATASKGQQTPWFAYGLVGNFALAPGTRQTTAANLEEEGFWKAAIAGNNPQLFEEYLQAYGASAKYAAQARLHLAIGDTARVDAGTRFTRPSVAVLGFANQTGRPETGWVATTLGEAIGTELGIGPSLRVVAAETVARMKRELSIPEADSFAADTLSRIRKDIDADFVVLGSVLVLGEKSESRIRLDLRVQDTTAGSTLASLSLSGSEQTLPDLIANAGTALRQSLGLAPNVAAEAATARAAVPQASDAQATYGLGLQRLRAFDAIAAKTAFTKVVAAEPDYAPAHAGLAEALALLGEDAEASREAQRAAALATALPSKERKTIEARSLVVSRKWPAAMAAYRELFALAPDDLEYGLALAEAQSEGGDPRAARETVRRLKQFPEPARTDPRIDTLDAEAAAALSGFAESRDLAANAAEQALARGAWSLMARAKLAQAWAMQQLGNPNEARALNEDAERLYSAAGDQRGMARALIQTGAGLRSAGRLDEAAETLKRALAIVQQLGNRSQAAGAANDLAGVLYREGNASEALTYYRQATALYAELGNRRNEAIGLGNVGSMEYELGQVDDALKVFADALAIKRELGDRRGTAITLENMAEASSDSGELVRAEQLYTESIAISREIGNQSEGAFGLAARAAVFLRAGRLDEALAALKTALDIETRIDEAGDARDTQIAIAQVQLERGDLGEAQSIAQRLLTDGIKNTPDVEAQAHAVLTSAFLLNDQPDAAAREADLAVAINASKLSRRVRFYVGLSVCELYIRTHRTKNARAVVEHLRDDSHGLFAFRLIADYLDARMLQASGDAASKEKLRAVATQAETHGFRLMAERARHAME